MTYIYMKTKRLLFTRVQKVYRQKVNEMFFQRPIHLSHQVCETQLKLENQIVKDFEVECGFGKMNVVLLKIVRVVLFSMIFGVDITID